MKIEIKNKFNNKIIISGKYESIKDCLEKNTDADLGGADLRGADLRGADLCGADLFGADLCSANLYGADLGGADLYGANLRGADLGGADLCGADLGGADLYGANLRGADLCGADLCGADLGGADLRGADLGGANLYEKVYIYIKGSSYDLYCFGNYIQIGCKKHEAGWWLKHGEECAKENEFNEKQIKEYKKYIDVCIKLNKEVKK